ncbi:hypothetical protein BDZ89DRAFT_1052968 [Hymenopellis radicata]|nr:hypothetical protein BDZ89DRAFT_1052968 [Hymenopellis radicata]
MASAVPRSRRLVPADNRQISRTGNYQVPGESFRKVPEESTQERLINSPGRRNPESRHPSLAADNHQTAGKMTIAIFVVNPLQSSSRKASIMLGNRQSKRTGNHHVPGRKAHKLYVDKCGTSGPEGGIPQTTVESSSENDKTVRIFIVKLARYG